jgi:tetratricopeptide (TPR) repeat protein
VEILKKLLPKWICTLLTLLLVFMLPMETMATSPNQGYIWDKNGRDVHSINGYVYETSIDGAYLTTGPFSSPEDIFIASDDSIYVVDTGNNRVVHLNTDLEVVKVIGDKEGPGVLNGPKGVYVKDDGTVYVADTKNQRIAIYDNTGKFSKELLAPDSPLLGSNFTYSPSKIVVDKRNYLYVVSEGNIKGLMQIDSKGDFKGFFGSNDVEFSLKRFLTRLIATEEQKAKLESVVPLAFSNLTLDKDGFIYTTTLGTDVNQLKRLSPVGVDTLNQGEKKYGDLIDYSETFQTSSFIDITVSEDGLITALDLTNSRIYQYDKLGNLLFVFGGNGDQNGVFLTPSSVDQNSEGIMFVVDKGRNRVDLFRTTPFADLVHEASTLYVEGRYEEAKKIWEEIINLNANFDIAYHAIGKALYKSEKYSEAMEYFKLANSKGDYSDAFRQYRIEYVRENFIWFFSGTILLFFLIRFGIPALIKQITRKRKKNKQEMVANREEEVS